MESATAFHISLTTMVNYLDQYKGHITYKQLVTNRKQDIQCSGGITGSRHKVSVWSRYIQDQCTACRDAGTEAHSGFISGLMKHFQNKYCPAGIWRAHMCNINIVVCLFHIYVSTCLAKQRKAESLFPDHSDALSEL